MNTSGRRACRFHFPKSEIRSQHLAWDFAKLSQRYFTYDSLGDDRPVGEVTHLTVDVICE